MQLRAVMLAVCGMLVSGCGGGGTAVRTAEPPAFFLPMSVSAASGSATTSANTGLFVVPSNSPGDPPRQITTQGVVSIGLQANFTLSAQGIAQVASPSALIYTTAESSSDNHVWSLSLSGASSLVPTQLSNLTVPAVTTHIGPGVNAVTPFCASQVIPESLADPSSFVVILALPTNGSCDVAPFKWVLIHSSDSSATTPIELAALSAPILPLYRPDGTLAGLVALDSSNTLNFYSDASFSNPRVLLQNVYTFAAAQEAPAGQISSISANPTYSFLVVRTSVSAPGAVYRIDYSGSISADLYDFAGSYNTVVDAGTMYFTQTTGGFGSYLETAGSIPGDGGPAQALGSTSAQQGSWLPTLAGVSGSNLVFWGATPQQLWQVQTLPKDVPGTFTTIASSDSVADVLLAGGDIFVNWAHVITSPSFAVNFSTQILDSSGAVLQPTMPSSFFEPSGTSIIQLRNLTDPNSSGGASVYVLDLSLPSSPKAVALKSVSGDPFNLPAGADPGFSSVTPTIGVANTVATTTGTPAPAMVYDLDRGVVVLISEPDANIVFLTYTPTGLF
jgi:hypothetical protein